MEKIKETLDYINSKTNNLNADVAIILGSGLGCFCDGLDGIRLKYDEIPHFGNSDVKGHKGELLFCEIEGKNCIIMQGRFHYYEGNSLQVATYPIKIFKKLGIKTLFITNAAGATHQGLNIGDIMLMSDHINFMGTNPLIGKNDESLGERFPDMSNCYTKDLQILAKSCAQELNIDLKEGIYLATTGPSYETAAEIRAFRILGADVVGMSSVPEAIVSNYLKLNTVGFSSVTNFATGVSENKLNHQEVLEIGKITSQKLSKLIKLMISKI
ncbi:MAG: purine-nucleoside phosphorylase [Candidatus Gastranaerophilales bacterium]|nr:purine-nucleoside phosphorylase [Candidatus Gastranaerophilales bacterium]